MSEQTMSVRLEELAEQMRGIYEEFEESLQNMGGKSKSGQSGGGFLRWITGGHVTTAREQLCEEFQSKVQGQLELFQAALEGTRPQEAAEACAMLADIMLQPRPARSNSASDLMIRAMASQLKPFLPYLTREKVCQCRDRMREAYKPRDRFPVEKELYKELERLSQEDGTR